MTLGEPQALADAFPKEHQALLLYVQRQLTRKQRPQSMTKTVDEDEDEGDAEMEECNVHANCVYSPHDDCEHHDFKGI